MCRARNGEYNLRINVLRLYATYVTLYEPDPSPLVDKKGQNASSGLRGGSRTQGHDNKTPCRRQTSTACVPNSQAAPAYEAPPNQTPRVFRILEAGSLDYDDRDARYITSKSGVGSGATQVAHRVVHTRYRRRLGDSGWRRTLWETDRKRAFRA